jgi:hypothetical protein
MQILRAGLLYFAIVFGTGFVLGVIRTLWVVPHVGTRWAELMETPVMIVVTILAARWVVLHLAIPSTASARLAMGGVGLGFLLGAELSLVRLRGLSLRGYFATRDPMSGTIYYLALGLFAAMPLLLVRR